MEKRNDNAFALWLTITGLYMFVLLWGSLLPYVRQVEPPLWKVILHNSLHAPAYAGLTFLWAGTLRVMKFCRRVLGSALAIAVAYGALIEVLQGNVQGREPSVIDLAINLFGGLAAVYAIRRGWLRIGEKA